MTFIHTQYFTCMSNFLPCLGQWIPLECSCSSIVTYSRYHLQFWANYYKNNSSFSQLIYTFSKMILPTCNQAVSTHSHSAYWMLWAGRAWEGRDQGGPQYLVPPPRLQVPTPNLVVALHRHQHLSAREARNEATHARLGWMRETRHLW